MAKICPKSDNWCTSDLKVIKTSLLWTINNFSKSPEKSGKMLVSSTFCADEDIPTQWCLQLYPNGNKDENKDFVGLFLALIKSDRKEVLAHFKLALIDDKQQVYKEMKTEQTFSMQGWGWNQFITRAILEDSKKCLLPNDRLTVYCEVTSFGKRETISGYDTELKRNHTLSDDMTALYQSPKDCDLKIVVKGHKFNAHKLILKTRSPVFAAMFEHPMKENQQNRVVIEDIGPKVFAKLLRFIYTDKVVNEDIDSNLMLLSAADKYNLEDLKCICEEYCCSKLTVESVSNALILADNHSSQELKTKSIAFIKRNTIEVMKTKGWKDIIDRKDLLELF